MSVPEAMLDPRLRRYKLRSLRFPLGSGMLRLVVPDGEDWMRGGQWLPGVRAVGEPPYWCEIWPASAAVARAWGKLGLAAGSRVLDLGCGIGLPGIAAARHGAAVTFFDMEQSALDFATWNAKRVSSGGCEVRAVRGMFGDSTGDGEYDWVALADVTYRPSAHGALRQQIARCLASQGVVVHADPMREDSSVFLAALGEELEVRSVVRRTTIGERCVDVRLAIAARDPGLVESLIARIAP